jgi:hypothetical protein
MRKRPHNPAQPGRPGRARPAADADVPYRRPPARPDAETVILPALTIKPADTPGPVPPDRLMPGAPDAKQPAETRWPARPSGEGGGSGGWQPAGPSRRRTWLSRAILVVILGVQAALSLRMHNTAFEDEALYLYSGHIELSHWLHGAALQGGFDRYFSGAPVLYPVLAAAVAKVGGLTAARAVSLVAMLTTTALLYSMTRLLFNERSGLCAAALFSVTESTIFLGNLATFDAPTLCLLALASWIVVRTAPTRWPLYLLATPVAALAVAAKYAALLFVPTIVVLSAIAAWPHRARWALIRPAVFGVVEAGLLAGALRLAGPDYLHAIEQTTTARVHGSTSTMRLLRDSLLWGGLPIAVALLGAVAYARRPQTEPGEHIAPSGGRGRRLALGVVLAGTALLAPAYQMHLHTDISLHKHIGFGLLFAAPIAGLGFARLVGDHFRRAQLGIAVWSISLVLGMVQADGLYRGWPDSRQFVHELALRLGPGAHYLVEADEVPIYYLMGNQNAQSSQFTSTYEITYTDKYGRILTGNAGFEAAVSERYFQVIAYNYLSTPTEDRVLTRMLEADPAYRLAAAIPETISSGRVIYYVWVRR